MNHSLFFLRELTATEIGATQTHETYIRLNNNFDYTAFFHGKALENGTIVDYNFDATNMTDGAEYGKPVDLRFVYYINNKNKEKRIPGLASVFALNNVREGDIVQLESREENGVISYYIKFLPKGSMKLFGQTLFYEKPLGISSKSIFDFKPSTSSIPLQVIYYGAPGTGKSHQTDLLVNDDIKNEYHQRTTFHPDSDYSSFVGCYKPTKEDENLTYKFVPQAFLKSYIAAWKNIDRPYYLIIEEINRGNCAQIFGDIFQLLDRRKDGFSKYHITTDTDIENYLREAFAGLDLSGVDIPNVNTSQIVSGEVMQLPGNLHILATMNTSDQSLFPIDSAFKRRWDWEYKPIEQPADSKFRDWKIVIGNGIAYDWWEFIKAVNQKIFEATHSEDKKMGYWFTKADDLKQISQKKFISKVLFYLWNDIFKDYALTQQTIFKGYVNNDTKETEEYTFTDFFLNDGKTEERINRFMTYNGVNPTILETISDPELTQSADLSAHWRKVLDALAQRKIGETISFGKMKAPTRYIQTAIQNDLNMKNIQLVCNLAVGQGYASVRLYIDPKWNGLKKYLEQNKSDIEKWMSQYGTPFWKDGTSSIGVRHNGIDDIEWQAATYEEFYNYFTRIIIDFCKLNENPD